ncbi:MAG TPA: hypothetical protein VJS92_15730 [Candidatus Polarisedimenticolaceae bacterium]|nr:hypothetical protein [Candidatus Polarisedimenticolaceae bacterium]
MLRGNSPARVDDKGRLKLPSSFRSIIEPEYGSEFFVTSVRGESVRLYPLPVYARLEDRLLKSSTLAPEVTRLRNAFNYYGQASIMDSQGRVLIHPLLRDKARIVGDVVVLGQQDYLEVWNRGGFQALMEGGPLTDADLRQLAELGF